MEHMTVIAVGNDSKRIVDSALRHILLITINSINKGSLGNFRTFIFDLAMDECDVIQCRKDLYSTLGNFPGVKILKSVDSFMDIYVFKDNFA